MAGYDSKENLRKNNIIVMIQRDDMFSKETCDKGIQCILKLKKDSFQISGRSLIFCKMKITANLFIV